MALTVNTNMSSLIAQRSLTKATNLMNTSIERMSTGYKINHSKDNAAGYSIANIWDTQLSSLDIAADNAATGMDLLTTAEETSHYVVLSKLTGTAFAVKRITETDDSNFNKVDRKYNDKEGEYLGYERKHLLDM